MPGQREDSRAPVPVVVVNAPDTPQTPLARAATTSYGTPEQRDDPQSPDALSSPEVSGIFPKFGILPWTYWDVIRHGMSILVATAAGFGGQVGARIAEVVLEAHLQLIFTGWLKIAVAAVQGIAVYALARMAGEMAGYLVKKLRQCGHDTFAVLSTRIDTIRKILSGIIGIMLSVPIEVASIYLLYTMPFLAQAAVVGGSMGLVAQFLHLVVTRCGLPPPATFTRTGQPAPTPDGTGAVQRPGSPLQFGTGGAVQPPELPLQLGTGARRVLSVLYAPPGDSLQAGASAPPGIPTPAAAAPLSPVAPSARPS